MLTQSRGAAAGWYIVCGTPGSVYEREDGCGAQTHLKEIRQAAVDLWNQRADSFRQKQIRLPDIKGAEERGFYY